MIFSRNNDYKRQIALYERATGIKFGEASSSLSVLETHLDHAFEAVSCYIAKHDKSASDIGAIFSAVKAVQINIFASEMSEASWSYEDFDDIIAAQFANAANDL